ncbi:MAG: hypothetical protein MR368_00335 [Azospirillum sp.]|nr:hypothetical protein [Azospirillum sp.]
MQEERIDIMAGEGMNEDEARFRVMTGKEPDELDRKLGFDFIPYQLGEKITPELQNLKDFTVKQETAHHYELDMGGKSYWLKKSKVDEDGNFLLPQKSAVAGANADVTKGILNYPKSAENGIEIAVSKNIKQDIDQLAEMSNSGLGKNLQDEGIDKFAEEWVRNRRRNEVENMSLTELSYYEISSLEEANEVIEDDPEDNSFDRSEPFKDEQELREFLYNRQLEDIENMDVNLKALREGDWDKIREDYEDTLARKDFFDEYEFVIEKLLKENGFYTIADESRISDSRYVDVYKNKEDSIEGEPFAKIRISDHDTHKFYGHHINLYTTENVYKEINKLLRSFAAGEFGVDDTVYYQGQIADNAGAVELTINTAEETAGVSEDEFKQKMLDTLKSFKGNKIFNQSLGGEIEIRTSSIKKYKSFFADKNKRLIVPYIPELLAKARFDKIEDSYIPKKETNVLAYYKADMPINIDNNTYNVHLTVKKDNHGNLFWDAQVQEKSPSADPATNPGVKGLTSDISEDALNITPLKQNVDRNLVVYHTISAKNLAKAIDFGGFPAPSLAIVKKDEPFNFGGGEGNIQLIGNKDLINPENGTEVYNRDVWTKTFPFATYETPTFEATRKFEKEYEQYFDRVNDRGVLSSLAYVAQSNPAAARDSFINSTGAKLAYLEKNKGKEIELPKRDLSDDYLKQGDIDVQFVEEVKDFDETSDREEFLRKISAAAKRLLDRKYDNSTSRFAQKLKQKMLADLFNADGVLYFGVADRYMNSAKRYLQTKGTVAVDYYAARDFINEQIKDETAYKQWATKQIEDNLLGEPKVAVGDELLPFTLENVTKAMIDGATQNAQDSLVYGSGKAIAAGAKALNSIEEIKLEGKKLVTQELSAEKTKQLDGDMEIFTKQFVNYDNENYFFAREAAYKALGTIAAKENPTIADLQKALDYEFGEKHQYSQTLLKSGVRIAKSIRNLSRYYFEAKPQRAVSLNEFSGAIIPTADSFNEIADKVAAAGLRVVRSDNQLEAVKQFEDVYFQTGELGLEGGMGKAPFGAQAQSQKEKVIYQVFGQYEPAKKLITLFQGKNSTTLVHELLHHYLPIYLTELEKAGKFEQLKGLYEALGVQSYSDIARQRAKMEQLIDLGTSYIYYNESPNEASRSLFERAKQWMLDAYDIVKKFVKPSKEVDEYFNVELHTEQIKGQDPNLLYLYHIRVKRNPAANLIALQGSYKNNIP